MTNLPDGRYILFRREWDAVKQKWNKFPCDYTGKNIDAHKSENWMSKANAEQYPTWNDDDPSKPYGLAWVLNGDGWFFIDMDNCREGDHWTTDATTLFQSFGGCMGEVSTSGTGLHIFGRCDPDQLKDRKNKWDGDKEFYTHGRFVALSKDGPQPIGGTFTDLDWTQQLLRVVPEREYLGELPDGVDPAYTGPDDDDELLKMAMRSGGAAAAFGDGVTFADLWEARIEPLSRKFPAYDTGGGFDHSSADAALMTHLAFWTGKDMPRMDRLFRRSALMREKYAKRADYRRDTIQKSARLCKGVYDKPRRPDPADGSAPHEQFMSIQDMMVHFAGCVYIRDDHKMLVPDGSLLKPEQFNAMYGGHMFTMTLDNSKPAKKAFEAFTENMAVKFPKVKSRCFYPDRAFGEIIGDSVNTYVAPDVRRVKGDASPFLAWLRKAIPDEQDQLILLSWCAALIQNPGKKLLWAPVLQGTEGNGKSMIGKILEYCVGSDYVQRPRTKELGSPFNGWLEGKILIIAEEIHMMHKRETLDDMKILITETRPPIRRMHQAEVNVHVPANWLLMSNHKDAVIKSANDRRYAVFFMAQQTRQELQRDFGGRFFPDLWDWLREDGFAIMADFFMTYAIDERYNPAKDCQIAPNTTSTQEAVSISKGGVEAEIQESIESGDAGFQGGWVSSWALDRMLKDKGLRISQPRRGQILREMGYESWGRSPSSILREGNSRPHLWLLSGQSGSFDTYVAAQGVGYN